MLLQKREPKLNSLPTCHTWKTPVIFFLSFYLNRRIFSSLWWWGTSVFPLSLFPYLPKCCSDDRNLASNVHPSEWIWQVNQADTQYRWPQSWPHTDNTAGLHSSDKCRFPPCKVDMNLLKYCWHRGHTACFDQTFCLNCSCSSYTQRTAASVEVKEMDFIQSKCDISHPETINPTIWSTLALDKHYRPQLLHITKQRKTITAMGELWCRQMKRLFSSSLQNKLSHHHLTLFHLSYTPSCLRHLICTPTPPQNKQPCSHPISCIAAIMNLLWFHNTSNYSTPVKIIVRHLEPLWLPFLLISLPHLLAYSRYICKWK